jgi:thioredoxin reductase (NADPH)
MGGELPTPRTTIEEMSVYDLVIVGAGPAGLAASIAAQQHGLRHVILEKGVVVNTILHFPLQMVFFTTPELLEIGNIPFVTPYEKPTRAEALRYYRRIVDTFQLPIEVGQTVTSVVREGEHLVVATTTDDGPRTWTACTVVIATGAYDLPNRMDVPGEDLPHVSHYYTEAHAYFRKNVVIVGGANSTADAALEMYRAGVKVTIVHRNEDWGKGLKYWVRPDLENRVKEGSISARMSARVTRITAKTVEILRADGTPESLPAAAVFLLTGYHSDTTLLAHAGVTFDPVELSPAFDPVTFETNVPGVYVIGNVTTGRQTGKIFIENGRFHGKTVVDGIAARLAEAQAAAQDTVRG